MKKIKIFAVALSIIGSAAIVHVAKAVEVDGKKHACVMTADTPTHATVDCIGDGTFCNVVGDCLVTKPE